MPQVDIITGEKRVRRWTDEEKASILAAAFAPGAVVREVARRANISTGQLYTWRSSLMKKMPKGGHGFARVIAASDQAAALLPQAPHLPSAATMALPTMTSISGAELPAIEIEVRGNKVRIPGSMPPALAAAVLRALVRRR